MHPLFETVCGLTSDAEILGARRYGVIEARDGQFHRVRLRPFPKIGSVPESLVLGAAYHCYIASDRCLLYYNQPHRFPNFLAVGYFLTGRGTRLTTIRRALDALDEIARIKRSDALLCDAANWRLSTALLTRWGWKPHAPSRWHRHFIRRFYGQFPPRPAWIARAEESELAAV